MKEFDDIKSHWRDQPKSKAPINGAKLILERIDFLKKKQQIMNIVLLVTIAILIWFFIYIKAQRNIIVSAGLLLMIGSLIIRIVIEIFSIKKLTRMDVTKDAVAFKNDMIIYYKKRIQTHYIVTPIVLIIYAIGFVILVPFFKQALSYGFYLYIVTSAIVVLLIMIMFIARQIKNELSLLNQIKN